ncbi:MAG: complex I NDUFA9 subunit family protein [Maricaulis sp.]|jgi:NADH dehydrogenase|nr:complex I NDUFA9 subunit family protein [Maricaulis sp.]HAQ35889.1 complex I NDUFA9 subunit family protein [Alphaproteobacteria bacterium]
MLRDEMVTVFGGSGFVGRYVVRELARRGYRVRVATRRPHIAHELKVMGVVGQVQLIQANVRVESSVQRAVEGASAVINLVGVLDEGGRQTFSRLHVMGAEAVAKAAAQAGVKRLVHISAIGADTEAESRYARTKGEGEAKVKAAFKGATILRPSIIFGTEDEFFNRFAGMASLAPALPLIGGGKTRLQPVWASDVGEAVANALELPASAARTFELGGPRVYTFRQLMEFICKTTHRKRALLPLPFPVASLIGLVSETLAILPFVPAILTRDQVVQLKSDNVVAPRARGIEDLGVTPQTVEAVVPAYLVPFREKGQFHQRVAD